MAESRLENLNLFILSNAYVKKDLEQVQGLPLNALRAALMTEATVSGVKPNIRFSVDKLLEYYGLIFIGVLSDYFPPKLPAKLIDEIVGFFEISPVRDYFQFKRKNFLFDAISAYCSAVYTGHFKLLLDGPDDDSIFNGFIIIKKEIENDNQVKTFLGLLEMNISLAEPLFENTLSKFNSQETIDISFNSDDDQPDNYPVGAIKFAMLSQKLYLFLQRINYSPILQSAIWHFYAQYFLEQSDKISKFYNSLFSSMKHAYEISDFRKGHFSFDQDIKGRSLKIIQHANDNISALCNVRNYEIALRNAVASILNSENQFAELIK